jgi:hypothetical protein
MKTSPAEREKTIRDGPNHGSQNLKLLIAGISGVVINFLLRTVTMSYPPPSVLQPIPGAGGSAVFQLNYRVLGVINSLYFVLPFFLFCAIAVFSKRDRPGAWLFAFLAGYTFTFIALHWILGWT